MQYNVKLAGVRPELAECTKIAQLPNSNNVIYEELRSEDQNPEAKQELGEKMLAEWVAER